MKRIGKVVASLVISCLAVATVPFNALANNPIPSRIAGITAEQTAVQIANQTGWTGKAILASSTSHGMIDALTAGPLAYSLKAPILLTGAGNELDRDTKAELTKLSATKVYVTSGTAVIKQGVIDELKGMGIEVIALGGKDRYETSVNIAKKMTEVTKVAIANSIPDALSIASIASANMWPILLTDKDTVPAVVSSYLTENPDITSSEVIGGTAVISDSVKVEFPMAVRHAGMTAYDTNNEVIQHFDADHFLKYDHIFIANGETGIDALAGAPLAAMTNSPIMLTEGKTVPAGADFIYRKTTANSYVTALGGEAVVPETVRAGMATGK